MLNVNDTVRAYSGKTGCMCGCLGNYNDGERARKMALTALLKNPDSKLQSWDAFGGDAGCLFVNTDTRTRVLYLTPEGVEKIAEMFPEKVDNN
jgi:hypothetical protein|tara:strand:- start:45 stop:323 length:279 start_codon:yes stop_codon:yes gene_type:complete